MHDKLIKYLEDNEIGHNAFSRKINTPPSTLTRILKKKQIPSLRIAIMIDKYTNGEISMLDWFSDICPDANSTKKSGNENKNKKNKK